MITAIDKQTALVLIDLQKGILKNETAHPLKNILGKAALLIKAFRAADLPIIIVTVNPIGAAWTKSRKDVSTVPTNTIAKAIANIVMPTIGFTKTVAEIKTTANDIFITKKTWNAFYNTILHETLQQRNITQIVLAGVSTSIGVEGTARAASELGYNIAFATDAITDRVAEAHEHSIKNIFPRIGELDTAEEIINALKR